MASTASSLPAALALLIASCASWTLGLFSFKPANWNLSCCEAIDFLTVSGKDWPLNLSGIVYIFPWYSNSSPSIGLISGVTFLGTPGLSIVFIAASESILFSKS